MYEAIRNWVLSNCKFAAPQTRKPFEDNVPAAPAGAAGKPVQPIYTRPQAPAMPGVIPMDQPGQGRANMYQNIQQMQPQAPAWVPQDPAWVRQLDPKTRQMYDTYKKQNNQKGLQMIQQLHGGKL